MKTKMSKTRRRNKRLNARKRSPKGAVRKETAVQGPSVVEQEQEEADRQSHDSDTESGLRKTEIDDEASVG